MRTFDGNLGAYHALNAQNDIYIGCIIEKLERASTLEEVETIMQESKAHSDEQLKAYKELGEEMAKIMNTRWWQFWKQW